MLSRMEQRPVIWVITDGKAGHESQSLGLANAIASMTEAMVRVVPTDPRRGVWASRFARPPQVAREGNPTLAVGAGSGTHPTLRAIRRRLGVPTVVLMRPSFGGFDLVVAPRHDGMREGPSVITTRGAITSIRPSIAKDATKGFLLIGGPSKHHAWSNDGMISQIATIVARTPEVSWTLTTSRRTPPTFLAALERAGIEPSRLDVWSVERTSREWLLARYDESATIWVSEDSVSMVYEALTSGATVGLLRVPRMGKASRVVRGVAALADEGYATWFDRWEKSGSLQEPPERLDEATRVAGLLVERFGIARARA